MKERKEEMSEGGREEGRKERGRNGGTEGGKEGKRDGGRGGREGGQGTHRLVASPQGDDSVRHISFVHRFEAVSDEVAGGEGVLHGFCAVGHPGGKEGGREGGREERVDL